jgi:hypothetical protein
MRLRAAPAAKDKKRHSLRRRVLRYVTAGDVVRTKVEFVGLVGEVMANHSFHGTGRLGELEVRWLPCACKGCFRDTPGGSCEQAEFNTPSKDLSVRMATAVNTKSSDERIQERAAGLRRRLTSVRGGCNETLAALFWNAGAGQEQWGLAELAGAPRDRAAGDVLGSVRVRSKSTKPADAVVPVRCFESVIDASGKGRRLFRQPAAEKCAKFTHDGCTCGKWHVELQPFLSVRPPLVAVAEKGRSFRKVQGFGDGVFELSGGHCQKIDYTCAGDEKFISIEGRGSLPVYREPAAAVPVVAAAASSSSSSSSSSLPLARFPPAADPAAAGAPAASGKRQHAAGALPQDEVGERARARRNGDS